VVTWEYPQAYGAGKIPYYPINNQRNNALYERYRQQAQTCEGLFLGGRLATYTYLDMDDAIASALAAVERLCG